MHVLHARGVRSYPHTEVPAAGEPSWGLLLRLRLHFCSHADSSARANAWQGERVSVDNEAKVYACIAAVCMKVRPAAPPRLPGPDHVSMATAPSPRASFVCSSM